MRREGERLPDPSLSFHVYLGDIQTFLDHENAPNAKKVPLKGGMTYLLQGLEHRHSYYTYYTWNGPLGVHAYSYDLLTREYATTPCNEEINLEFLSQPRASNGGLSIIPQWPCRPLLSALSQKFSGKHA